MAGNAEREVIREFLATLGFHVDQPSLSKFAEALTATCKRATKVGAAIAGVGVAAEVMVTMFSRKMERLYYASQRTNATVGNLNAMRYAAEQIGVSADTAQGAIESLAATLRTSPGHQALLNNILGRNTSGEDPVKLVTELVKRLGSMPHFVGSQYAQMFGMDEQTFFQLKKFLPEYEAAQRRQAEVYRKLGIDQEAAARASREYMNTLRGLWMEVEAASDGLALRLLPYFQRFSSWVSENLPKAVDTIGGLAEELFNINVEALDFDPKYVKGFFDEFSRAAGPLENVRRLIADIVDNIGKLATHPLDYVWDKMTGRATPEQRSNAAAREAVATQGEHPEDRRRRLAALSQVRQIGSADQWAAARAAVQGTTVAGAPSPTGPGAPPSGASGAPGALFAAIEKRYALPAGLLDRMWDAESSRGRFMTSPAGAQGHFGWMPATQREFGMRNPNDLEESADKTGLKMQGLLRRYSQDLPSALAAYNWGEGNFDKYRLGQKSLPKETRGYVDKIAGGGTNVTLHQENNITVTSSGDPHEDARRIGREAGISTADAMRNLGGGVRIQ